MADTYQAIYDATRSRITNGDVGQAIHEVARQAFDISFDKEIVRLAMCQAADEVRFAAFEQKRPSVLFRPTLSADGNMWCALLGDDLHSGVAGFGETPAEAMVSFDLAFLGQRTPAAHRLAREAAAIADTHAERGDVKQAPSLMSGGGAKQSPDHSPSSGETNGKG